MPSTSISKESYEVPTSGGPSTLQRFFILCSGAEKGIVYRYPSDWNKYAGVGATIFLTACLAAMSGGYAIDFVFDNVVISIFFGIFWALLIFNLDRYIVLSLHKPRIPTRADIQKETNLDRKEELTLERRRLLIQQGLTAAPRFLIAIIIALTISKPIELRLFNTSIEKQLEGRTYAAESKFDSDENDRMAVLENKLDQKNKDLIVSDSMIFMGNPDYRKAEEDIPTLKTGITQDQQLITANKAMIAANLIQQPRFKQVPDGNGGYTTLFVRNDNVPNEKARAKINENKRLLADISEKTAEINELKNSQASVREGLRRRAVDVSDNHTTDAKAITQQIEQLKKTLPQRKEDYMRSYRRNVDLPARLEALGDISKPYNAIWWCSLVITLLFLVLETSPVVVKLLTRRGPYDEVIDGLEYAIYLEESRKIDELNREVNALMEAADQAAAVSKENFVTIKKAELERQLLLSGEIMNKVAARQQELADIYIEAWYQQELRNARLNVQTHYQHINNP